MAVRNIRIELEVEPGNTIINPERCVVYVQEDDGEYRALLGVQIAELMLSKDESYFYMEKYPDSEMIVAEEEAKLDEPTA